MKILAIDTSCDETAAAVTDNLHVLSNIIWSQASLHAKFGGVMPSLAQREHEKNIDWVIDAAIKKSGIETKDLDAIAVTVGPGLSIALGVGIDRAKKLATKLGKQLIPVNHIEAHLLSSFANSKIDNTELNSSLLGLVVSGGNTQLILLNKIGDYQILAETQDDALGEALDKGARLLNLGYPGGQVLELLSRTGDNKKYTLPLPLVGDKIKDRFSYSGLKTAFVRLFSTIKSPNKQDIADLGASFQNVAFDHILKVLEYQIAHLPKKTEIKGLLLGGGVANNILLKSRLRKLLKHYNIPLYTPYSKRLLGDNAAMIGVCAYLKCVSDQKYLANLKPVQEVDRNPRLRIV